MPPVPQNPAMYEALAEWFHLLTAPEEYAEEAEFYREVLQSACEKPPRTLLELGSGGGNNASHLKSHFQLTLTDISPSMLRVSQELNPECEHLQGDMRTLRLHREFDAVFVHDAVNYLTTLEDLSAVLDTAFAHCRPGGAVLLAPDHTRESFQPGTGHGGHDQDGRGLRYLEWNWDPDPQDSSYLVEFAILLKEGDRVRPVYERHQLGLFSREDWLGRIRQAGFAPGSRTAPFTGDGGYTPEIFTGSRA